MKLLIRLKVKPTAQLFTGAAVFSLLNWMTFRAEIPPLFLDLLSGRNMLGLQINYIAKSSPFV